MLLNCHYLHCIVSKLFDSWKHLIPKVCIRVDLWLLIAILKLIPASIVQENHKLPTDAQKKCIQMVGMVLFAIFYYVIITVPVCKKYKHRLIKYTLC